MHMTRPDRCGRAGDGGYIRSPMPSLSQRQTGGLSPNEPWPPLQDHNRQPRQPLGFEVCVIGWWRWSGSLMTQIWSWLSLITLALYRHPIRMNSALHKSTREKYWFYTIHFLKYIQSKISYVSIMSCSQSALVCNYMHLCVSVYQNIQYISHSRESLKAATYLVKEWVLREDLLKGTLLSKQINKQIYFSFYTPWRQTFPTGLQLHVKYPNIYNLGC